VCRSNRVCGLGAPKAHDRQAQGYYQSADGFQVVTPPLLMRIADLVAVQPILVKCSRSPLSIAELPDDRCASLAAVVVSP
jgi:hypothetical protein